jgi:hypothetical protein
MLSPGVCVGKTQMLTPNSPFEFHLGKPGFYMNGTARSRIKRNIGGIIRDWMLHFTRIEDVFVFSLPLGLNFSL